MKIKNIIGREILDSRGNPTVEVDIYLENNIFARASVPSGASTGIYEAYELRDNDNSRYLGKGVEKAVFNINNEIKNALLNKDSSNQKEIDERVCEELSLYQYRAKNYRVFRELKKIGYNGPIIIEREIPDDNRREEIKKTLKIIKPVLLG